MKEQENISALEVALNNEMREREFYLKHAERTKNSVGKAMFKQIADEIGDVLWYVARLSHEIGFELEDIAVMNINKLESRKRRGVISGNGDKR